MVDQVDEMEIDHDIKVSKIKLVNGKKKKSKESKVRSESESEVIPQSESITEGDVPESEISEVPSPPTKIDFDFDRIETEEKIGIHPYWLRDIQTGAIEELRKELKKWSTLYKGYLIGFEPPIQRNVAGENGRYPHPYIYYTFHVVRYIYKPTVGQRLKGSITLISQDAASCTVFDKFTATVYPHDAKTLSKWKIGDTIEFTLDSFDLLRESVILRGSAEVS